MTQSLRSSLLPLFLAGLLTSAWLMFLSPDGAGVGTSLPYHIDLNVYREGGRALLRGENLYTQSYELDRGGFLPFTYPPFAALLFSVTSRIPLWPLAIILTIASFAALWLSIFAIAARTTSSPALWASWGLVACMATEPVWETINFGQINLLLAGAIVLDCLLVPSRSPWRGVFTGVAISIKLTPAVFLAVFFVRREWRALTTALVTFLACGILGFLAAPASSATYWTRTLWDPTRIGSLAYSGNQSLQGLFSRIAPEHATSLWFVGCGAIVAALWWIMERTNQHSGDNVTLMLLASSAALLCSPVSWSHHYTWLTLAAVYLVLRRHWALAALTWLALLARGHWLVPYSNHRELGWSWWQQIPGNDYVVVTVSLVVASAWFSSGSMGSAWRRPDHPSTGTLPKAHSASDARPAYIMHTPNQNQVLPNSHCPAEDTSRGERAMGKPLREKSSPTIGPPNRARPLPGSRVQLAGKP